MLRTLFCTSVITGLYAVCDCRVLTMLRWHTVKMQSENIPSLCAHTHIHTANGTCFLQPLDLASLLAVQASLFGSQFCAQITLLWARSSSSETLCKAQKDARVQKCRRLCINAHACGVLRGGAMPSRTAGSLVEACTTS